MADRNIIQFECPRCLTSVRANSEDAGKRIDCPSCKQSLLVPGQSNNQDLFDDLFESRQPAPPAATQKPLNENKEPDEIIKEPTDASAENLPKSRKQTETDPLEISDDPLQTFSENQPEAQRPLEHKDPFEVDPDAPLKIDGISDKISHESVFGIKCSVCDTHIHVTPDQIGSQVKCPECFTKLSVKRPETKKKKSHRRWKQQPPEKSHIRSTDDEYALSEPIERPKIDYNVDPSFGLDAVTEDLLAPRRSEEEVDSRPDQPNDESTSSRADSNRKTAPDAKPKKSRRELLEAAQQRNLAQQKSSSLEVTPVATEQTEQGDAETPRFPEFGFGSLMAAVTRMFTSPGLIWRMFVAWLLMGIGWAMMHQFTNAYEAANATDKPTLGNWALSFFGWFMLGALPFIAGTLLLWFICGYVFRNAASGNRQVASWGISGTAELSSTFLIFSFSFLVAGLPLLFVPFLINPFRFLVAPLLLLAAWYNGSPMAIVSVDAFQNFREDADQWKSFYLFIILLVFLALIAGGLLMIQLFLLLWVFSLAGMAINVTLTIAFAAVAGWHCGIVVQSLENKSS